jgi:hypothetical protein
LLKPVLSQNEQMDAIEGGRPSIFIVRSNLAGRRLDVWTQAARLFDKGLRAAFTGLMLSVPGAAFDPPLLHDSVALDTD